jgi:hypothetical protein
LTSEVARFELISGDGRQSSDDSIRCTKSGDLFIEKIA